MGGLGEDRKFHLVSWDIFCSLITCGGLMIHNLRHFNKSSSWEMVLGILIREGCAMEKYYRDAKYGRALGSWCSNEVRSVCGVGLWKYIRMARENFLITFCLRLEEIGFIFVMIFGVGNWLSRMLFLPFLGWQGTKMSLWLIL